MLSVLHTDVQHNAAGALGNLAMTDSLKTTVINQGGLIPLVHLASCHCSDETGNTKVQRQVTRALFTLSAISKIRSDIVSARGVRPLVKLAQSSLPDIQRDAAGALANFAIGRGNKRKVIKCGGLVRVLLMQTEIFQIYLMMCYMYV